jgi:hypothetical protein
MKEIYSQLAAWEFHILTPQSTRNKKYKVICSFDVTYYKLDNLVTLWIIRSKQRDCIC